MAHSIANKRSATARNARAWLCPRLRKRW